jgi:quercetin dioxygenase-like cupin family protein
MTKEIVLRPGEGEKLEARGSAMVFKAMATHTNGAFSFMERTLPPRGESPSKHTHAGHEAFYVLDGKIEFTLENEKIITEPGTFILVPPGSPHAFANTSGVPARLLILHAPAMDAYFRELEELWANGRPSSDEVTSLMKRHYMKRAQ